MAKYLFNKDKDRTLTKLEIQAFYMLNNPLNYDIERGDRNNGKINSINKEQIDLIRKQIFNEDDNICVKCQKIDYDYCDRKTLSDKEDSLQEENEYILAEN